MTAATARTTLSTAEVEPRLRALSVPHVARIPGAHVTPGGDLIARRLAQPTRRAQR